MSDESIDVAPSAENGNLVVDAPSEPAETTTPVETKETVQPTEPTLYDLPDGRKVDASTLAREFKENFLPDYTRKSQTLAEIEKNKIKEVVEDPYAKPDYVPKNYREVINIGKQEALQEFEAKEQAKVEEQQKIEKENQQKIEKIEADIVSLKSIDPKLNEEALFKHANDYREKYGIEFPTLQAAYQHMKDIGILAKTVQQTTAKNIQKRNDPVSTANGKANGTQPNPKSFTNALQYLKAIKG